MYDWVSLIGGWRGEVGIGRQVGMWERRSSFACGEGGTGPNRQENNKKRGYHGGLARGSGYLNIVQQLVL